MNQLVVTTEPHGKWIATWLGKTMRCAIGRGGVVSATHKQEGDGATPAGTWPMRELFYRADRLPCPTTALPCRAIMPQDGWCDAPHDPRYNQFVQHPYPTSAERLWLEETVYDLIIPLGYNDGGNDGGTHANNANSSPIIAGKGSAIFLHCATPDYAPTAGCVALNHDDLLWVLATATSGSVVVVI